MLDHTYMFSTPDEGEGEAFAFVKIAHTPVSPVLTPIYGESDGTVHLPLAADAGSASGAIYLPGRKRALNGAAVYSYSHALDANAAPPKGSTAENGQGGAAVG